MMIILAWVFGVGGVITNILIYQQNTRKRLLTIKWLSDWCWALHYGFLGAWSGAGIGAIGVIRETVFLNEDKKWAQGKRWLVLFWVLGIVSAIVTWKNWFSILPTIASALSIFSFWIGRPNLTRLLAFPISGSLLIYNITCLSYVGIVNELFVLISSAVGLIRMKKINMCVKKTDTN